MRPIDADALIKKCGDWYVEEGTESGFIGTLKNLLATEPTIQPEKAQLSCEGTTSDTISKTDAVEHLRRVLEATVPISDYDEGFVDGVEFGVSTVSTMPPVQPVATDTNVGDKISRQAAIDVIEDYPHGNVWNVESMEEMVDKIKDLPPAQPEPPWILCSEKMPEEHEWLGTKKFGTTISDEVYVTFENDKGERFCKHMTFQNGELSRYDKVYMDAWYKGSKPIAWMPLPEPYKLNNK